MRFQALRHRNFRLYFAGQILSMSGTWMQRVAEGWLVYRLTHSPLILGYLAFAGSAPALFLSPVAGVIADQVNRHRMVQVAQALAMAQAFTLALFTLQGWITPNLLLIFALIMGTVRAFANPARQSFLVELIPAEDLTNAVALSAMGEGAWRRGARDGLLARRFETLRRKTIDRRGIEARGGIE